MYATMEIAMNNDLREITVVAAKVDDFCETHNLQAEISYSVNLALEELLANTISYGYKDEGSHRLEIILRLEENALIIIVVDDGIAFNPTQVPDTDNQISIDEPEIDGLGLLLINRMMDGIDYQRRANCNIAVLTKNTVSADMAEENS